MKSLRAHLTLRLFLGGALLLAAAGGALDWMLRRAFTAEFDQTLRATAQNIAAHVEHKSAGIKSELEVAMMPQFNRAESAEVFLIRTVAGAELDRSVSLGDAALPLRSGPLETPDYFDATLPDGRVLRCAGLRFLPIMGKKARELGLTPEEAVITTGRDRAPLDRTLAALHAAVLLVGGATLGGLIVIVRLAVRGGLAPLDRLGDAVAGVDAASLATRFPVEPLPLELRPIVQRLNELLARLGSAFEREQRFTATAAHEFRTPLAELRALAEVSLSTPATAEDHAEAWRDALAATRRMEALALRLLELTRAEDPASVIRREPVALAAAVADAWQPWGASGRLVNEVPPALTAATDSTLLAIVLGNLCGNAAAHANGETLRVTAAAGPDAVTLHFRNAAGALTAADLPRLFERFWRKDGARSDGRHHGLGLALAADFATLLGGGLAVRLDGADVEFSLRLPVK